MGSDTSEAETGEELLRLRVDENGRIHVPEAVRDRFDVEPGIELPARRSGDELTLDLRPSARIQHASADRDDWTGSTPVDAGESMFGDVD